MNPFKSLLLFVIAGALFGWLVATLAIVYWVLPAMPFTESVRSAWLVEGIVAGAVLGAFGWILVGPAKRLSVVSGLFIAVNCAAWASYLAVTPTVAETEF